MEKLPPGLRHVLSQTKLYTDDEVYVIVDIPLDMCFEGTELFAKLSTAFSAAVVDKDQLTLVLPSDDWAELGDELGVVEEADGYRLITFDLPIELGLVGYLATLAEVLAESGVSIFAVSAYQRDHLLVKEVDFERAWEALKSFIASCREPESD